MIKNVSPKLIENVKDLKISLNELTVYDLNVYSSIEIYYKVANKLNEVIKELSRFEGVISDEVVEQNEKLIYLLGEGLENEVVKEIDNLINKGFFDTLLNKKIFNNLKTEFIEKLDYIDNKKLDKTGTITVGNLGQDVKEMLTGGSVAVVGNNMVNMGQLTSNIQNDIGKWVNQTFTLNNFGYNTTTGKQDSSMDSRIQSWEMSISSGERLKISGFTFGSSDCCIMFLDSNDTIISKIGTEDWGTPVDYEFTCPTSTSKVIMNCWINNANKIIEKFEYIGIVNKDDFKTVSQLNQFDIDFISNIKDVLKDYDEIIYNQNDFAYSITGGKPYLYETGGAANGNAVLDVYPGEVYKIDMTTISTLSAYSIILTDKEDKIIYSQKPSKTLNEETYTVEITDNISKMYVSFRKGLCVINKEKVLDLKGDNIPNFYVKHVESKINEINIKEDEYGANGTTISFITDIHYPVNKMYSFDILKKLIENTNIEIVVSGGDNLRDDSDITKSRVNIREFMKIVKTKLGDKFITLYGNHDNNSNQTSIFTSNEVYSMYFKNQEKRVVSDNENLNGLYWYKDDEVQKIRYIALNTFEGREGEISVKQMKWLCEKALNLPSDGWYLAFFSHSTMSIFQTSKMKEVRELINAIRHQTSYSNVYTDYNNETYNINKDFTNTKHSVLFAMAGHNHIDRLEEDNGITYVQSICDARYKDDETVPVREKINLQSFDIITINKTTNTVDLIRVGAGENRSFTFINNNA